MFSFFEMDTETRQIVFLSIFSCIIFFLILWCNPDSKLDPESIEAWEIDF